MLQNSIQCTFFRHIPSEQLQNYIQLVYFFRHIPCEQLHSVYVFSIHSLKTATKLHSVYVFSTHSLRTTTKLHSVCVHFICTHTKMCTRLSDSCKTTLRVHNLFCHQETMHIYVYKDFVCCLSFIYNT